MQKFLLLILAFLLSYSRLSAQCEPQLLNCSVPIQACDTTPNNDFLWNAPSWLDNVTGSHDLAETPVDLDLLVKDDCPNDVLSVRCLLFLDLDGDGIQETVVDSNNPPSPGTVNFNNYNNPNYTGGTPRVFDQHASPDSLKFRFTVYSVLSGDTYSFRMRWVKGAVPNAYYLPELPSGVHKVRWTVTNSAGVVKTCEQSFIAKDCKAPVVNCLNGLSVNVMPTQMIQLWATDFLQNATDNVTPSALIKYGVRRAGAGTGFPVDPNGNAISSIIFTCADLGTQVVELWAIDLAGNASYCETNVIVQDNLNVCSTEPPIIKSCITFPCPPGGLIDGASLGFLFNAFGLPQAYFYSGICAELPQILPANTDVTIVPSLDDNPLNGVSNFDLVIIGHHIDGSDPFDTPYQWIAADANNDKVIDAQDILECQQLILGIYSELPNNTAWRFVDKNYVFPSPNPLSQPFPESITVNTSNLPPTSLDFVAVKICDLSCGNMVGFFDIAPEGQHLIGTPQPNPATEGAALPIQLVAPELVSFDLMDLTGRLLFQIKTNLPAGPAMIDIPAAAMPAAGMYVWHIQAGAISTSGKITKQ